MKEYKRYAYGMVVGRFQPFHHGHECIIARALEECHYVVVLVGSAQESRLPHNPLTFEEREQMINDCFFNERDRLIIVPLEDRTEVSNDASWGKYMMDVIKRECNVKIDAVFEGREKVRKDWYDDIEGIDIVQLNRKDENYSATMMRQAILEDKRELYIVWCANNNERYYDDLRRIMLDVTKDTSSN